MQLQLRISGCLPNTSISGTLSYIWRSEGVAGLLRGNTATVLRIIPYTSIHFGAYENYRRWMLSAWSGSDDRVPSAHQGQAPGEAAVEKLPPWRVHPVWDLLAGSASGATAVILTYPLDLVRTRLAWQTESAGAAAPSSAVDGTARTLQAGQSGQPPTAAKSAATAAGSSSSSSSSGGAVANGSGSSRAQNPPHSSSNVRGAPQLTIRAVLATTARHEGLQGLYRGMYPTLLGILPYAGLKFYVYQSLKHLYWESGKAAARAAASSPGGASSSRAGDVHAKDVAASAAAPHHQRLPLQYTLFFGGLAGLFAQTVTYPFDIVRRRMQVQGLAAVASPRGSATLAGSDGVSSAAAAQVGGSQHKSSTSFSGASVASVNSTNNASGMAATLRAILSEGGWRSLFRGLSINYLKVVPSTAIGFSLYEGCKSYLACKSSI